MSDLPGQMQNVWSALAGIAGGRGSAVMFVSARTGTGTSLVARAFAQLCAARAPRSAWLLDLDLFGNGQLRFLAAAAGAADPATGLPAGWPGPYDMTFAVAPFWRATPRGPDGSHGEGAVVAWRVGGSKLFVSGYRPEALAPGQTLQVAPAPGYWSTLAAAIDVTVVDAPALERSRAALALAADMDAVILVVDGADGDPADVMEMRDELLGRGATILGAVVVAPDRSRRQPRPARRGARPDAPA